MVGVPSLAEDAAPGDADEARPEKEARHSGRLLVRMPATLHGELARTAEAEGVSLNQLINDVLAGAVGWRAPDGEAPGGRTGGASRATRIALVANFVVILVVAIAAIVLLAVSWQSGW